MRRPALTIFGVGGRTPLALRPETPISPACPGLSTPSFAFVKVIIAKEIQGKPSRFLGLSLRGLGHAWLNLVRLGSGFADALWTASEKCARGKSLTSCGVGKRTAQGIGLRRRRLAMAHARCGRSPLGAS